MDILAALAYQERVAQARGELDDERRDAIDAYLGRPYGDETEHRSSVVMRDVADTIEWIKPSLLKIFAASDEVVSFEPFGPEDEEQAAQETEYCNHVLMTKNQGFLVLHDWFHDALLQRTGYVLVRAVTKRAHELERYRGLTDDEVALVMQAEGVEVEQHAQQTTMDASGVPYTLHDVAVRQVREYSCIETVNIPPERVLVAPDWPHMHFDGCPFVEIVDYCTISQLREMGYEIDDNISDASDGEDDTYDEALRAVDYGDDFGRDEIQADPATRRVRVRYAWMRYDDDGDGIAELRRLVVVGSTILENEEDDLIPVASLCPSRMPHEHVGLSVHDWVKDLQRIRTVLMRGFLDNMYLSMYPQIYVDKNRVNLDDLLVVRPGGIRRVDGIPQQAVMEQVIPDKGGPLITALELVDSIRENRTGVTRYNQGLDANTLNKTATGIQQIMSASQQRIELIARVFAETGVKALMLIIHAMSIKHGRQQEMVRLRNRWIPIDPRGWKHRRDMTVSVGIGTGNKDQMLGHLMMILQEQKQALAIGLARPHNLYATLKRLTQNAGFKNAEEFWSDPAQTPPQPPQVPPEVQREQMRMQAEAQRIQFEAQQAQQKAQADAALERERMQMQLQVDQNRQEYEARQQEHKMQLQAQLAEIQQRADERIKAAELEFQRWKVEYEAQQQAQIELLRMVNAQEAAERAEQSKVRGEMRAALLDEWRNTAPVLMRDASGRVTAVERGGVTRKVKRDEAGRAVGLE